MASNDLRLNLILQATDKMSTVVKSALTQSDAEFEKMNKSLEATAGKYEDVGKKIAGFGTIVTAAAGLNLKLAGDFESGMNNVSTLIDTNSENLGEMGDKVLQIGKDSPKAISDLTDGLYSIRSAGISANEQFKVLSGSEHLAVAGLSTTAEAVDIATSAINAFGLKGKNSQKIYDMFFKVVKYGKTNISEFAQGFGSVAGVVAAADIKLDEYSASVAAMTTSGVKANIAHTQMKAVIAGLSRATDDQIEIFKKLGAKSFKDLIHKSGGMVNALDKIKKAVNGDEAKIISLVGSVEAYNAVMSLTGANNAKYVETLNDMRYGSDSLAEAYAKQTDGLNNQMAIIRNNLQTLGIKFGTALIPAVKAASGTVKGLIGLIDKMPSGLTNFLAMTTTGIGIVSVFGGTSLMVIGNIIKSIRTLRVVMRAADIAMWANPALLPVIAITAGIAALAAGAVYCYNKLEGFRNICDGTWAVVKAGGAWLAVLWQSFLTGAGTVWNFIKPAVKFAGVILSWITPIGLIIRGLMKLNELVQKAGGWRGFGDKMKNWAAEKNAQAQNINGNIKTNRKNAAVDGSHAAGLDYVPFDNYIGRLHEGEAVLTKPEADRWRRGQTINNSSQNTTGITLQVHYNPTVTLAQAASGIKDEFMTLLMQHKEEIVRLILELLQRREARAY